MCMGKFRMILLVVAIVMLVAVGAWMLNEESTPRLFDDVPENHWAYSSIKVLVDAGIITKSDGEMFYGEHDINHADMAQATANMLLKLSPASAADAKQLTDSAARDADKPITRYEIAVMLADVYKKLHKGELPAATQTFKDVPADHPASESVNLLTAEELMDSYANGTFRGNKTMTRYEAAALIGKVYRRLSS